MEQEIYACQKCIQWGQFREKEMIPALTNPEQNTPLLIPNSELGKFFDYMTWPLEIFPEQRYRLKLLDSLIVGRIWQLQARQLFQNPIRAEMIKQ